MSRPLTITPGATYADILALPDGVNGEILGGDLVVSPRPASPHAFAGSTLGAVVLNPFGLGIGGPGGWWILDEPELHLGDDVMVPDIAGWRKSTMPVLEAVANFKLRPDWVCEVLSPSTTRVDRLRKQPRYLDAGVGHLWLVDPLARTVEDYRAGDGVWLQVGTFGDSPDPVGLEPFEEVPFDLNLLWLPEPA